MRCFVRLLCSILALLLLTLSALAATRVDLNDNWQFRTDPAQAGESQRWFQRPPDSLETVSLPHTWSIGRHADYMGTAWYFKSFSIPAGVKAPHIELHFGATFNLARVWLNGEVLGEHDGGFTEYFFDITQKLRATNYIVVELNNQPKVDTIPGIPMKNDPADIYDWWPYGGITRGAWLAVGDSALVRWQHIDSRPNGAAAQVSEHIQLESFTGAGVPSKLKVAIFDDSTNAQVATATHDFNLVPGKQFADLALQIPNVRLWSLDHPTLYRSEVTLLAADGRILDTVDDNFGVRTIEIRDRHFFINGERVRLSGLARHETSPWEGMAETRGTIWKDYDDLKALHTTIMRPVHYPQHPLIYDYADRNGILMIPEVPMWQFSEAQMTNPRVIALAEQQLREMIEQNYNHPAIFAWSTDNESSTDTPGGIVYFKRMYALAKQLDPERYVSLADDRIAFVDDPATNASSLADFVMWNEYFGTWDGPDNLLPAMLEKVGKGYPPKMVIVSEFGMPGLYAADEKTADLARIQIIREHLAKYAEQDWIAAAIQWCYQDYRSFHNVRPGHTDQFVDHAVVTKDRLRRPSYYVWQQETAPVRVHMSWSSDAKGAPTGLQATLSRRSEHELPSFALHDYRVEFRLLDENKKEVVKKEFTESVVSEPKSFSAQWTEKKHTALRAEVAIYTPAGFLAQRRILTWRDPAVGGLTLEEVEVTEDQVVPKP